MATPLSEVPGQPFEAAPFARPLPEGQGLRWADPRELHQVDVTFAGPVPEGLQLQYWRCRWPQVRLPKDQAEGRGSAGWWQLGDWYNGQWQTADSRLQVTGSKATFTFRPLTDSEFPELAEFPADFRTTLQIRVVSPCGTVPTGWAAYTDSVWESQTVTVLWAEPPADCPQFEVFNGELEAVEPGEAGGWVLSLKASRNPDPHSFDGTLLTISGAQQVTVALADLQQGPVWVADFGLVVVGGRETRDYAGVCAEVLLKGQPGLREAVAGLPEQTWPRAWSRMVPKRQRMYLPLAPDGSRHRFALNPDGSLLYRTNNDLLLRCPGADSERLAGDAERLLLGFGLPAEPADRYLQEGTLPLGHTVWETPGGRVGQVAFATVLGGTEPAGPAPASDAGGVALVRFYWQGPGEWALPLTCQAGDAPEALRLGEDGHLWSGERLRAMVESGGRGGWERGAEGVVYRLTLGADESETLTLKVPYVAPAEGEIAALGALDFDREQAAVADYWRAKLGQGMKLLIPETDLQDFFQAVPSHTLISSELEVGSRRRFARAGSFGYLVFANESCMMITDLDRRGYHQEARECLEAFLHYQGSVPLPGDFKSAEGVFWGVGGYEALGYNQHHGWVLWCLGEHYRFTRDREWLQTVAEHVVAGARWIIRERQRALPPDSPEAGLLPPGNLEDITDWWPWLSTNAYSWRGLDTAAWALEQLGHPEASALRAEAQDYRQAILRCFRQAASRAPVVRLRNGTCVPHFPSHVYRRGRTFGWICETLEGAIHLLISGLLDPHSREAGWIMADYEDNLYLSEQYGYAIADFERNWFDWGGFSMQACLLLDVEPCLLRDEIKHALRATFNAIAANYYPDTRMLTEHALPELGDWRGDHYKSPDEANACGWLRQLFVREEGEACLLLGQGVVRDWLRPGGRCGVERAQTHFGEVSLVYEVGATQITARLEGPRRNPPPQLKLRFRAPLGRRVQAIWVNGIPWEEWEGDWVCLPGTIGTATVTADLADE